MMVWVFLVAGTMFAGTTRAALRIDHKTTVDDGGASGAVRLASLDLTRDLNSALGQAPLLPVQGAVKISIRIDSKALTAPETFRIEIDEREVRIIGADVLGTVYGIYAFSHQCLGVDPYWYWKNLPPQRRDHIDLEPRVIESKLATFRYRGWFINDEDLLTEWKAPSGPRDIRYPFYATVINLDIADRIFETLLRTGGNLVIPASFLDVMNDPEARLLARAVGRGLYVTQHHIEPMGMSFFGFENYWRAKGQNLSLTYGKDPAKVHQTWLAYARKWREIAGDQVIWQLGLRGKGDRPLWASDATVTEAQAADVISSAMNEQVRIIRQVDPRKDPPMTTTLWLEMSKIMATGKLRIPAGVANVFCDEGKTQMLQEDFVRTQREPGTKYGVYYHLAFWKNGPHLVQGTRPARLKAEFDKLIAKGDTHYAIVNVSNIREHLLGIEAAMSIMRGEADWDQPKLLARFAPAPLVPLYEQFLAAIAQGSDNTLLQDGHCYSAGEALLGAIKKGSTKASILFFTNREQGLRTLAESIVKLDEVIGRFDQAAAGLGEEQRAFYRNHLVVQAKMLRGLYTWVRELSLATEDRTHIASAAAALEMFLKDREDAATGPWQGWYTGDKKANVPKLLAQTKALMK